MDCQREGHADEVGGRDTAKQRSSGAICPKAAIL